jgi:hypothetical protein
LIKIRPESDVVPIIPAFRRLRLEDCEFEVSLDDIVRPCNHKKKKKRKKNNKR